MAEEVGNASSERHCDQGEPGTLASLAQALRLHPTFVAEFRLNFQVRLEDGLSDRLCP